jgi:tetratricopeptide (TPR) repeat protein
MDEDMSVRAAFDASYASLSQAVATTYRALGLNPGPVCGAELVAAATDTDLEAAQRAVNELVDASLLEEVDDGYYQFHDLIRVHARDRARLDDSRETRAQILRRIVQWYEYVARLASRVVMPVRRSVAGVHHENAGRFVAPAGIDRYDTALRWLERERRTLVSAVRTAAESSWNSLAYQLANALQPLFVLHKYLRDAVEVDEVALGAARAMDDRAAENRMGRYLARAWAGLGEFTKAEQQTESMLEQSRRTGDRRGVAHALKTQGLILVNTGQLERAVAAFQEALGILRALERRRAQGLVLINLGEALLGLGELDAAAVHLEQAHEMLSGLTDPAPFDAARAVLARGLVELQRGHHLAARAALDDALSTMTALRSTAEQARAHRALAELARQVGDVDAAERHERAATELDHDAVLSELDWDG